MDELAAKAIELQGVVILAMAASVLALMTVELILRLTTDLLEWIARSLNRATSRNRANQKSLRNRANQKSEHQQFIVLANARPTEMRSKLR